MARGRPKKKLADEVIEAPEVETLKVNPLFARQKQLLDLIQAMKNERAEDVGYLEVLLSRVNSEIAKL